MLDVTRLDPQPAGFGLCGTCSYRDVGSAAICFACASRRLVAPTVAGHCTICDQQVPSSGRCSNYWCRRPVEDRYFEYIFAIAMRTGWLSTAIDRYKTANRWGWGSIFGRVLVGYLDQHRTWFADVDMIIANPTFVDPNGRRAWDHIALIVEKAAIEAGGRWPFYVGNPGVVIKTAETDQLRGKPLAQRRVIAETQLRPALSIPDPFQVVGKHILVFDDVFTDGSTLREIARALRAAGAESVAGLVLARQPWTS